MKGKVLLDSD